MKISEIAAGFVVSFFFLAFAGVFMWGGIWGGALPLYVQTRDARAAENYVPVPAEVESVTLDERSSKKGGTWYFTKAQFSYTFEGRPYRSKRVSFNASADQANDYQHNVYARLLDARSNGRPVEMWVDPKHPENSVYDRSIRSDRSFMYLVIALTFTSIGLGALIFILRGWWRIYKEYISRKEWEAARIARARAAGK
jgi:hypothetical protein